MKTSQPNEKTKNDSVASPGRWQESPVWRAAFMLTRNIKKEKRQIRAIEAPVLRQKPGGRRHCKEF